MLDAPRGTVLGCSVADATLLSDVNRWVGVGIALVGSVVVAPEGTVLLWRSTREWVGRRASQMRTRLARLLPFLHRQPKVIPLIAAGAAMSSSSATVSARGRVWMPAASVVPGVTSVQALAARHRIPLNRVGGPVLVTTGRRLASDPQVGDGTVVVMLDRDLAARAATALGRSPTGLGLDGVHERTVKSCLE